MARTINQIYTESVKERNQRLELKEFNSNSKMSVMNGLTWAVAAIIHSFEVLIDVFTIDISNAMDSRVNGTPLYYANALLQYQKGDDIIVRSDGLGFGYDAVDESKRIITQVAYTENWDENNRDYKLVMKTATTSGGELTSISKDDLVPINAYIRKFAFAGTNIEVTSQKGDVLIPKLTVYYNGSVSESEMYDTIVKAINTYVMNMDFDSSIYISKIFDVIQAIPNIVDVHIDESLDQGVFIGRYNSDGEITSIDKIDRMSFTSSGFIRESSKSGVESELANFRESIKLVVGK